MRSALSGALQSLGCLSKCAISATAITIQSLSDKKRWQVVIIYDLSLRVLNRTAKEFLLKTDLLRALAPVLMKTVLPSALGASGAMAAVIWSDGFRAFCGL